jgi:glutathione S-transferase
LPKDATRVDRSSYPEYPNPFGSIPAAADVGGVSLFESGAILQYVADKYGGLDTPEKRAAVGKWIMWANASLDPICFKENERGQVIGTKLTESPRAILILEALLGESEWLLGDGEDSFSAADVAVGSYLLYALLFNGGLRLAPSYPNIAKYCKACAERPAYQKAFTPALAANLAERAVAGMGEKEGKKEGLFGMF